MPLGSGWSALSFVPQTSLSCMPLFFLKGMLHDEQPQSATFLGVFVSVKRIVNLCVLFGILNCARGSSTELTQAPELLKTAKP